MENALQRLNFLLDNILDWAGSQFGIHHFNVNRVVHCNKGLKRFFIIKAGGYYIEAYVDSL
jgi:hypothetical protein